MCGGLNFWLKVKYKYNQGHTGSGQAPGMFQEGDSHPSQGGSQQQQGVRGRGALEATRRMGIRVSVALDSKLLPPSTTDKGRW